MQYRKKFERSLHISYDQLVAENKKLVVQIELLSVSQVFYFYTVN